MAAKTNARSTRVNLRVTREQKLTMRCAAEAMHKSLNDFILESACLAAVDTLLDQRLFTVSGSQYRAFMQLLKRPETNNPELDNLFSRQPVWVTINSAPLANLIERSSCGTYDEEKNKPNKPPCIKC